MPDEASPDSPERPFAGLVMVSTPIGNLGDVSPRARHVLQTAELVLCEDTRHTGRLLSAIGADVKMAPLHEHNESVQIEPVLSRLRQGARIALVSDAGMPLVSDPGYRLVRAAIAEGLPVTAIPGPNAALTALVLSGLPPLPFLMLGFPPPRAAARRTAFGALRAAERAGLTATLLFHESPHRLAEALADLADLLGPRPAAVARELTKRFEEVVRATLPELAARYAETPPRGEITLVVGPPPLEAAPAEADLDALLRAALEGHSMKEAVAEVTAATGLPRRQVYARALGLAGSDRV